MQVHPLPVPRRDIGTKIINPISIPPLTCMAMFMGIKYLECSVSLKTTRSDCNTQYFVAERKKVSWRHLVQQGAHAVSRTGFIISILPLDETALC